MPSPLEITGFSKYYGSDVGVENISLEITSGEVFGFLGPNGAGKTTTIRTILDFIRPSEGKITVFGQDSVSESVEIKSRIGYLSGEIALYQDMTGQQFLRYMTALGRETDWEYVTELAERLEAQLDRPLRSLSKGNKQKIGLLQAFMHRPDLLVLDEPTSGLDPLMQQVFYEIVEEAKAAGKTVFISSHNLNEVQRLCDRAGFIRRGKLIGIEDIGRVASLSLRKYSIRFAATAPLQELEKIESVSDITSEPTDDASVHVTVLGAPNELLSTLVKHNVEDLSEDETSLEDVFMHYYREQDDV